MPGRSARLERHAAPRTAAVTVLALVAALLLGHLGSPPAARAADGTRGKIAGYGVTTSSGGDKVVVAEADRMAAPGMNMVSLEATWAVETRQSSEVRPTPTTVSDADLLVAARRVREAGMNVMLTVKIFCSSCREPGTDWRGLLQPDDRAAFFRSYREMSNHYAELAAQAGAAIFFVGSEMNSLQNETSEWRQVVLEARQRFGGRIGYQANWDAMTGIGFWPEVDIAGVSAYFPLSDERQPNVADLLKAWRASDTAAHRGSNWYAQVEAFARSHRKPVLFGEIGYQSALQAGQKPFYKNKFDGEDEQLQADLYQAALTTFEDRSWWLGAIWWEYVNTDTYERDFDYSPRGKLAEQLLTRWYDGERPATPERSLVGTTRPSAKAPGEVPATGAAQPPTSGPGASAPRPAAQPGAPVRSGTSAAVPSVPPSAAAVAPVLPAGPVPAPVGEVPLAAAPELPPVLAELDVQTVDDALARAALREEHQQMSLVAAGLLAPLVLGHAVAVYRRVRRPDIFPRQPR